MSKKTKIVLNKALGVSSDLEVKMIDYFFDDGDDFKGVTGSNFYFISPEEINSRNDLENIKESYDYLWSESVACGKTEESLETWLESLKNEYLQNSDSLFVGHDTSDIHYLDQDKEFLKFYNSINGVDLKGCYDETDGTFECVGGGRCFSGDEKNLKKYVNPKTKKLHDLARDFEKNLISIEQVENVLKKLGIDFQKITK